MYQDPDEGLIVWECQECFGYVGVPEDQAQTCPDCGVPADQAGDRK